MNPFLKYVSDYSHVLKEGALIPLGGLAPLPQPALPAQAPKVLLFSPHPDDECIAGALPLRLLREAKYNVIDVAVTQGSLKERQAERLIELKNACGFLGLGLIQTRENGLEKINVKTRDQDPKGWAASVETIVDLLHRQQPRAIFFPHELDWNSSHIGTHFLAMDALQEMEPAFSVIVVETEFWGQMATPNLMVESTPEEVADLVAALSFHVGEVKRNPYHLRLPAWMQDNVRRGGELVGGQGGAAPDYEFSTLYRLSRWANGRLEKALEKGRSMGRDDKLGELMDSLFKPKIIG
ncbi:MAG TPA: PIG-L family deacetylase [Verrucomicrobia bacterium]|nr:MAG: LmbE family protein [Lentisphaerae bacterium GWF2_57_35]HBA84700.1 PIG-L family deacetylase [Verrucomicrobiota bacterium]